MEEIMQNKIAIKNKKL